MAINAPQNMQPPQAPSTPVVAQQALNELIDYYRQLADYHHSSVNYYQQLVEHHSSEIALVEKQLASVEALLDPLTKPSQTQNGNVSQKSDELKPIMSASTPPLEPSAMAESSAEENKLSDEVTEASVEAKDVVEPDKSNNTKSAKAKESDADVANDSTSTSDRSEAKTNKTQSSKTKAKKTKATRNSKKKSSQAKKSYSSRLPNSPLLETHETIGDAVAACLQEHYPQVMSADDVLIYFYPEGLSGETKKRAYGAFSNTLSKGAGNKGWVRESIGKYRWREGI